MTTSTPPSNPRTTPPPAGTNDDIIVYSAALVIPVTAPVIPGGAVAVRGDRVLHVGTRDWVMSALREEVAGASGGTRIIERHWHGLLTPGLVNAHTHLQYTGMAAVGQGEYHDFHEWEDAFDAVYDDDTLDKPWRAWAERGARMLVEHGTTAAADIATDLEAAGALHSQGLHGITYWEVMNWREQDWTRKGASALRDQLMAASQQQVPHLGISPHAPYSLDSAPLLDLPDIARGMGLRLHIHLGETPIEAGAVPSKLSNYTSADWNRRAWTNYAQLKQAGIGASAIQFVDQLGVLGPDVHIAHGVYATREDRRILRQRGVSVALCPRSNRITCTKRDAPVARYLEEGNLVSVGTDSLSSSPSLDVLDDLAMLYELALEQGYDRDDVSHRLIRMVTLGGAEAMGLNTGPERIGQINAGATADLAFFDIPCDTSTSTALEDTLDRFVRLGAGTARATVLSGRLAYNDGAFPEAGMR